ncbi:MAG: hypothetical protein JSU63_05870 [Phycisphaerales bacterium]|nr:MAG: hypothetical protein JSU63_05870 [Phycisphaerales bacterium]
MHIKDARGRKVTQIDPVALYLLRQHEVIEADVLRAIVAEEGVRATFKERATVLFSFVCLLIMSGFVVRSLIVDGFSKDPYGRTSDEAFTLYFVLCLLFSLMWSLIERPRIRKIAAAMLKYLCCPHCGYDLRMLPAGPEDGATICPECGCAWKLNDQSDPATGAPTARQPSRVGEEFDD